MCKIAERICNLRSRQLKQVLHSILVVRGTLTSDQLQLLDRKPTVRNK